MHTAPWRMGASTSATKRAALPTGGALHESTKGLQASLSKYLYHVSPGGAGGMPLS